MKPFLRSGDFWSGLALAALGTYIVVQARGWVYMNEDGPGAGFFPIWYGGLMVVLSLLLVVGAVVKPSPASEVRWKDVSRALVCWVAFTASVALMPLLGFVVSFALLTFFVVRVMCGERHRTAFVVAIAGAAAFYALFEMALDLSLPHGFLF
jgi:putative tricarboxylic transport membrane protein